MNVDDDNQRSNSYRGDVHNIMVSPVLLQHDSSTIDLIGELYDKSMADTSSDNYANTWQDNDYDRLARSPVDRNKRSSVLVDSGANGPDDTSGSQRPFTVATSSPTKSHAADHVKRKKAPAKRAATTATATGGGHSDATIRPRSAGLNGWGDFDADRLLAGDDFEVVDGDHIDVLDRFDPLTSATEQHERTRSRQTRHTAPVTAAHNNAFEDFPALTPDAAMHVRASREAQRPATHVLRQRALAAVEFTSPRSLAASCSTYLPQLVHSPLSLSQSQLQVEAHAGVTTFVAAAALDAPVTRAAIFARFVRLWRLMPSQPAAAATTTTTTALSKSPFVCSVTLMKLCKSAGVTFRSSAVTAALSHWNSMATQDVDFASFCTAAVRLAVQPTFQQQRSAQRSASLDMYIATLDEILDNTIASVDGKDASAAGSSNTTSESLAPETDGETATTKRDGAWRLKELGEIQSLGPQLRTRAVATTDAVDPQYAQRSTNIVDRLSSVATSNRRREPTLVLLPADEARATHSESIRRKVQLYKSWQQPRTSMVVASLSSIAMRQQQQVVHSVLPFPIPTATGKAPPLAIDCSALRTHEAPVALRHDRRSKVEAQDAIQPFMTSAPVDSAALRDSNERLARPSPEATDAELVLVCGACTTSDAVLWCAGCFSVFCVACWQQHHALSVDTTTMCVNANALAPTAKPLQAHKMVDSSVHANANAPPPIAMHYLRTKPLAVGTLAKGTCSKWKLQRSRESIDTSLDALAAATATQLSVSSHALLPALHPTPPQPLPHTSDKGTSNGVSAEFKPTGSLIKTHTHSSAPLLASNCSSNNSSNSSSVVAATASRKYADPTQRTKLQPASVILDPTQLLADRSNNNIAAPRRRRHHV